MNDLKIEVTDIALAIDSKIFKCLLEHCKEVISDNIKDLFERATILMRSETEYEPNIIISNLTHRDELEYLFEYTATKVFYSKLVDENTLMFLHYSEKACIGETFGLDFNLIHPELCIRGTLLNKDVVGNFYSFIQNHPEMIDRSVRDVADSLASVFSTYKDIAKLL